MNRRLLLGGIGLVLALCLAGWRYWPRSREASAASSPALAALGSFPVALWVAYPHQNLALWERSVGHFEDWLGTGLRASGRGSAVRWPGFGPFVAPPARELAVGFDPASEALEVRAAVYPEVRWIARSAGALAGNPWLSGGPVEKARGGQVSWEDGAWVYRRGSPPPPRAGQPDPAGLASGPAAGPAGTGLAALRLPGGGSEPGSTSLCRVQAGAFRCGAEWELPAGAGGFWRGEVDPFAPQGRDPARHWEETETAAGGWFLLPEAGTLFPIGVVRRDSAREPELPAEGLLDATGALAEARADGWVALVPGARREAAAEALLAAVRQEIVRSTAPAARLLWLRPDGFTTLERVRLALEEIPFVAPREIERWRDLENFLRPFSEDGLAIGVRYAAGEISIVAEPSEPVLGGSAGSPLN